MEIFIIIVSIVAFTLLFSSVIKGNLNAKIISCIQDLMESDKLNGNDYDYINNRMDYYLSYKTPIDDKRYFLDILINMKEKLGNF